MVMRWLVRAGTGMSVAIAAHTAWNLRQLRTPGAHAPDCTERVAVLIPARNESSTIVATVHSALAQEGVPHLTVTVLDDESTDDTAALVTELATTDPRLTLLRGENAPPSGWLGKPWACARLARHSDADVLVFVDADVVLAPHAVRALVDDLRTRHLGMVAPYPAQQAGTWLERLVQPLVTWSWVATMPLAWAEQSTRTSLSAANGQVLAVDAHAYRTAGGHDVVREEVLEDIALMRAFKASGQHAATVDGSQLATCRMYSSTEGVIDGYGKSLWDAFGGPIGSIAVTSFLALTYVVPAAAMVASRRPGLRATGAVGSAAGVASRAMVARRVGEPLVGSLTQPASVAAFVALNAISWRRHLAGTNRWKGRPVTTR